MELFSASNQWSQRPADQRFASLDDLIKATNAYRQQAAEKTVNTKTFSTVPQGREVALVGKGGVPAQFTHWAFGQFAQRVGAPADYLRKLTPELASANLNYGLAQYAPENLQMLVHTNGSLLVRAMTSDRYARFWNHQVAERMVPIFENGWRVPPARPAFEGQPGTRPATTSDLMGQSDFGLSIREGDQIAPAGLYASDHDMFIFAVNPDRTLKTPGRPNGLMRGVFIENSEVGAASLKVTRFLLDNVCGNHIVWGAEDVLTVKVRHTGDIQMKADGFFAEVAMWADESASDDEAKIAKAAVYRLGQTKDEVLDKIFGKGIVSRKQAETAFDLAQAADGFDGRTAFGLATGLTRLSQQTPYMDRRVALDRAAYKVLSLAF